MRMVELGSLAALLVALGSGCKRSSSNDTQANGNQRPQVTRPIAIQTAARFHWLGKKRLSTDTNASYFLSIWNLPETARLQDQTLGKLADAIASKLSPTNVQPATSNQRSPLAPPPASVTPTPSPLSPVASLLRPLLADLLEEESYLELGSATNQPCELLLAVRLSNARALVWETNLTSAFESLGGSPAVGDTSAGRAWTFSGANHQSPVAVSAVPVRQPPALKARTIHLDRVGDWTVVGFTRGTNVLHTDALARTRRNGVPFAAQATNFWVDATFDLPQVARALATDWHLPENCPQVKMTITGEGENVRTHGELEFPHPIPIELESWTVPTNLIHDPLTGFCAVRGVRSWLKSLRAWHDLQIATAPNQIYSWSQAGAPVQEYFAAPWAGASNVVHQMAERLPETANPWLTANSMGRLSKATESNGIVWDSAPFVAPHLRSIVEEGGEFAFAGLIPQARTNLPPPLDLLREVVADTNRLYYAWEVTAPRIEQVLYLSQLIRLIARKAQLPAEAASLQWLKAAAPKLGNCVTVASRDGPGRVLIARKSSFGLDSVELHLLADWLESPRFPSGLHTTLAPSPHSADRAAMTQ